MSRIRYDRLPTERVNPESGNFPMADRDDNVGYTRIPAYEPGGALGGLTSTVDDATGGLISEVTGTVDGLTGNTVTDATGGLLP